MSIKEDAAGDIKINGKVDDLARLDSIMNLVYHE
jgi:hypothetical protein